MRFTTRDVIWLIAVMFLGGILTVVSAIQTWRVGALQKRLQRVEAAVARGGYTVDDDVDGPVLLGP